MYERRGTPPLTRAKFFRRLVVHTLAAVSLFALSLLAGMLGYEQYEHLPWRDAFLNASMLLGGMGPINAPASDGGKVFAGLYALYAGLVFLIVLAIVVAPMVHRMLHVFHWEQGKQGDAD